MNLSFFIILRTREGIVKPIRKTNKRTAIAKFKLKLMIKRLLAPNFFIIETPRTKSNMGKYLLNAIDVVSLLFEARQEIKSNIF
ncbi:hypothetical protein KAX29_03410 [candidate division WOR-3 bacterium]|nr:hypothetical protein [candidate division WOR-3 bacterium]